MKINEVIVEAVNQSTGTPNADPKPAQKPGLWSRLKTGLAGARAGMQQSRDTRAVSQGLGARANQANLKLELDSFNRYLSQALAGQPVTPQILQATAQRFVNSRYPSADPAIVNKLTSIRDLKSATNYISQSFNSAMANRAAAAPAATKAAPAEPASQKTSAGIEVPFSAGAGPRKTEPAASPEQQAQKQAMAQGISVVSHEPIIIRNKTGKEFGLNDKGQWIHLSSGKIPAEAYQAFLSQQHDISLGLK